MRLAGLLKVTLALSLIGCQPPTGDTGNAGSASSKKTTPKPGGGSTPNNSTPLPPNNGVGTLTGDTKCWKKMLETPEYLACKGAGKVFNRIKEVCIELGLTLTGDCSKVKSSDIQDAQAQILKPENLPKAYLTVDQCGTYTMNGKQYAFAYVMGQQFFEDAANSNNPASYKINVRKICYHPETGNPAADQSVCVDSSVNTSDAPPVMADNLGSCD